MIERFDFSRPIEELIQTIRDVQQRRGIACLFNVNELYVEHTAAVAVALGMPGVSPLSAPPLPRQEYHAPAIFGCASVQMPQSASE